jgi:hypothetical protein
MEYPSGKAQHRKTMAKLWATKLYNTDYDVQTQRVDFREH